jgi:hypothetical protein
MHHSIEDDPCLRNTTKILDSHPFEDYKKLLNQIQRHTKYAEMTCLCKKASKVQCRYNFPWNLRSESSLFTDDTDKKKYELSRNDDLLNIHNPDMLTICRENMDFQPILSRHAILKYISKYELLKQRED